MVGDEVGNGLAGVEGDGRVSDGVSLTIVAGEGTATALDRDFAVGATVGNGTEDFNVDTIVGDSVGGTVSSAAALEGAIVTFGGDLDDTVGKGLSFCNLEIGLAVTGLGVGSLVGLLVTGFDVGQVVGLSVTGIRVGCGTIIRNACVGLLVTCFAAGFAVGSFVSLSHQMRS